MTIREAIKSITSQLATIYDEGEAEGIARLVIENITGNESALSNKQVSLSSSQLEKLEPITRRLLQQEPVQYILQEAWFNGMKFYVDPSVLIPRSETEELVHWIVSDQQANTNKEIKILDIGTGSGCIAISLKKYLPNAKIWACDNSPEALSTGMKNAIKLEQPVHFVLLDFLDRLQWSRLPHFDLIVSNPPYIPVSDKKTMSAHVKDHEPPTALFVPDNDPLIFYKAIAEFATTHLNSGGHIYCETHEDLSQQTALVFETAGYTAEVRKDMQQKDRMVKSGLV